jgi:hypothetical protein
MRGSPAPADVRVDQLTGSMDAQVSGVGKVDVADGRASLVHASVSGIGRSSSAASWAIWTRRSRDWARCGSTR